LLAVLREIAKDAEGREQVAALRRALIGTSSIKAALECKRPERRVVSVIVSSWAPSRVNSRDTLARRVGGEAWSRRMFWLSRSAAFNGVYMITIVGEVLTGLFALGGALDPLVALSIWPLCFFCLLVCVSAIFTIDIASRSLRTFDAMYLVGNILVVAVGGRALFEDARTGALWFLVWLQFLLVILCDSIPKRTRWVSVMALVEAVGIAAAFAALYFQRVAIRDVTLRVLNDTISVNTRVQASMLNLFIFLLRVAIMTARHPDRLILLGGLRNVKVLSSAANDVLEAHAQFHRRIELAQSQLNSELNDNKNARTGTDGIREQGGARVHPAGTAITPPPLLDALAHAAGIALRQAVGEETAARDMLLAALDRLLGPREQPARSTLVMQRETTARWALLENPPSGGVLHERLLVPRFAPTIIDSSRTIAARIGGKRLNDLCYRVCSAPLFAALNAAILLPAYGLFCFVLSSEKDDDIAVPALLAVYALASTLNAFYVLLLNEAVLRKIVLVRFEVVLALASVICAALCGAFIFSTPQHGTVWAISQLQMLTYYCFDAAPPSRSTRRLVSITLTLYAAAQAFACFALWRGIFHVHDYWIRVLGVSVNIKQWTYAATFNAAIFAARFAWRAIADQRNLIFCAGLMRVRLPAAEARELRALMLAIRQHTLSA
jgi:hypothetical protein